MVTGIRRPLLVTLLLSAAAAPWADQAAVVFDSSKATPVESVPLQPTRFTLRERLSIGSIQTFHWNGGKGATPGSIALQSRDKRLFGPWKAEGLRDAQGVENAYWEVKPDLLLAPGSYTILDSDPVTWSRNPERGNIGIARVLAQQETAVVESETPTSAAVTVLTPEQQQQRADELFEQIRQADNFDYAQIESLYLELLRDCPDSEQAEESYFRLSNLYRLGMDPPELGKLRDLLEAYLARYPASDLAAEMRERLRRVYEETGQWSAALEIYEHLIPDLTSENPYYLVILLDYARVLEGSGARERALAVYQQVAQSAVDDTLGSYDMSELWLRAAQERIAIIDLLQQERWPELVVAYRKQFDNMGFAEMPQIQELLEYAQVLEQSGDRAEAIKRYRQVLRTDQRYQTRQAQQASVRLEKLVGSAVFE